ncbi:hypothetical protein [Polyangium fumosum]|uniref:Uncharacterized protein n=1 Tax=Polyangium fumosum TaxID=889272 RepID=A0A4U1IZ22_9BACT|nr:hypothetical protein [Polyangium fumosum]TKC99892.1 hypothetical protein E8A74_36380 [Polyangium fumosum]
MALDLSISHGQRTPPGAQPDTSEPSDARPESTRAEGVSPVSRALSLAQALADALTNTCGFGVNAAAQHELSLAHSLASHVVDILAGLPPESVRSRPSTPDAEE